MSMSIRTMLAASAIALTMGATMAQAAPVGPAASPFKDGTGANAGTTQVQHRYHRGHRHSPGRRFGRGVGIGLGVGVLGAIIADQAYRPRPSYYYDDEDYDGPYDYTSAYQGDPRTICAQNFRWSFEWRTGLYTTFSGEKRLCPYLR